MGKYADVPSTAFIGHHVRPFVDMSHLNFPGAVTNRRYQKGTFLIRRRPQAAFRPPVCHDGHTATAGGTRLRQ